VFEAPHAKPTTLTSRLAAQPPHAGGPARAGPVTGTTPEANGGGDDGGGDGGDGGGEAWAWGGRDGGAEVWAVLADLLPEHVIAGLSRGEPAPPGRAGRAAVLFADLVGYTARWHELQVLGPATWARAAGRASFGTCEAPMEYCRIVADAAWRSELPASCIVWSRPEGGIEREFTAPAHPPAPSRIPITGVGPGRACWAVPQGGRRPNFALQRPPSAVESLTCRRICCAPLGDCADKGEAICSDRKVLGEDTEATAGCGGC
jgi:hypothetical protein